MILLDTHAVIWLLLEPGKLSPLARNAIRKEQIAGQTIGCSVISLFEIAYLVHRKRITLNYSLEDFLSALRERLSIVSLTQEMAIVAAQFPNTLHGDPIDRLIAATALGKDFTLLTIDGKLRKSGVCKTLW